MEINQEISVQHAIKNVCAVENVSRWLRAKPSQPLSHDLFVAVRRLVKYRFDFLTVNFDSFSSEKG